MRLIVRGWTPPPVLNGAHGHWARAWRQAKTTKEMTFIHARQAGWRKVNGKARLTITLTFPVNRTRDTDNIEARVKHCVDGLKPFFVDDSPQWLERPPVIVLVQKGVTQTEITLEEIPS